MSDYKLSGSGPGHSTLPASPLNPYKSLPAFESKAKAWEAYTNTPLGQLRQALTQRYLAQHLGALSANLNILDVGGGTGGYALPLAQRGHQVCLLDFSPQMLAIARQKAEQLADNLNTVNWELTAEEIVKLDDLSQPRPIYPHAMLALNVHGR